MAPAVTEVWQQVHDRLRAFIAKRIAADADVDDILQDVFLRMHRRIDGLQDASRVVAWVYQIARHAIIDHYRAPNRRREVPVGLSDDLDVLLPFDGSGPGTADSGRLREELAGCLRPMIERLAEPYRTAVTLVEIEGFTQAVAARRVGVSVSGMKSRVQRGRRVLKQMLDNCCEIQLDPRGGVRDVAVRDAETSPCGCPPGEGFRETAPASRPGSETTEPASQGGRSPDR